MQSKTAVEEDMICLCWLVCMLIVYRRLILLCGLLVCLLEQDFQIPSCLQAEQLKKKQTTFACK